MFIHVTCSMAANAARMSHLVSPYVSNWCVNAPTANISAASDKLWFSSSAVDRQELHMHTSQHGVHDQEMLKQ